MIEKRQIYRWVSTSGENYHVVKVLDVIEYGDLRTPTIEFKTIDCAEESLIGKIDRMPLTTLEGDYERCIFSDYQKDKEKLNI